jgi:hypothetical protein
MGSKKMIGGEKEYGQRLTWRGKKKVQTCEP